MVLIARDICLDRLLLVLVLFFLEVDLVEHFFVRLLLFL